LGVFRILQSYLKEASLNKIQEKLLPFNRYWIKTCTITPLNVYFDGPVMEEGNRIVRRFERHINNFMRVTFEDEDGRRIGAVGGRSIEQLADEYIRMGGSHVYLPVSGINFYIASLISKFFNLI
jgi:hypothetical protein